MSISSAYNSTPGAPAGSSNTQPGLLNKVGSGIVNAGKDVFNTLIGTPATRLGQAVGSAIAPSLGATPQGIQNASQQSVNLPLTGTTLPAQKAFGQGGAEQIGGQALKSASYLIPGAEAEGVAGKGIINGAIQGAKLGVTGGALAGAGNEMSQGASASDVGSGALKGAVTGGLTGGVLGGAAGAAGNIWDHVNNPTATEDAALATRNAAADTNVNAANEMSNTVSDFKGDLNNSFSQAPKAVEQADPTARFNVTPEILTKLNDLKDTKTFALPDYLRASSPNFGEGKMNIAHIGEEGGSGIKLSPSQTQDLITRLNDLTYKAKASGDLAINQQTVGLVNDIKNSAQDSFGHVTDAQGNSVWNRAYQDYRQGTDAIDAMSDIIHVNKVKGGMSSPVDINKSIGTIQKLGSTPEGKVILQRSLQQFKDISGYDLTNPAQSIMKSLEDNAAYQKAIKGGYLKQMFEGAANPRFVGRRVIGGLAMGVIGISALGVAVRKALTQ